MLFSECSAVFCYCSNNISVRTEGENGQKLKQTLNKAFNKQMNERRQKRDAHDDIGGI